MFGNTDGCGRNLRTDSLKSQQGQPKWLWLMKLAPGSSASSGSIGVAMRTDADGPVCTSTHIEVSTSGLIHSTTIRTDIMEVAALCCFPLRKRSAGPDELLNIRKFQLPNMERRAQHRMW